MTGSRGLRLAVIGHPIAHSLSPVMHRAALAALGIEGTYEAIDVEPDALAAWVRTRGARLPLADRGEGRGEGGADVDLDGFNVTVPHKEPIVACLDAIDADARTIGAVNTVERESDGRLVGSNTDAPGLVAALAHHGVALAGATVLIVGAGGSARAAVVGLARAGALRIVVAARRVDRAAAMLDDLRRALPGVALTAAGLDALGTAKLTADVLVHTTSATLEPGADADRFAQSLPFTLLREDGFAMDLVYARGPEETAVVRAARAHGKRAADGLEMLVQQGARSLTRWIGSAGREHVIADVMRAAIGRAVGG